MPANRILVVDFHRFACFVGTLEGEREPDGFVWALTDNDAREAFAQVRQIEPDRVTVVS